MGSRDAAIGRLLARSLTRPVNVLVGAAVVAAGIATGIWLLVGAGVLIYGALAVTTFLSPEEARRALGRPERPQAAVAAPLEGIADGAIITRYADAHAEYRGVTRALAASPVPLHEIEIETAGLMDDLAGLCRRAQAVTDYLDSVDEDRLRADRARVLGELADAPPDIRPALTDTVQALDQQIATVEEMRGRLRAFDARMGQVTSALGAIRGEIATIAVESEADTSERIVEQVHGAREMVTGLTATLESPGGGGAAGGA